MKITKDEFITFLIDVKGYNEEDAKEYITFNGVNEIKKECEKFFKIGTMSIKDAIYLEKN